MEKKKKHVWLVIPPVILKEILKIALKLSAIHFFFIHVSKTKHMDWGSKWVTEYLRCLLTKEKQILSLEYD